MDELRAIRDRFFRQNARLLAAAFRTLADQVDLLVPGSPVLGFLSFNLEGARMQNPTVKDNQAPFQGTLSWIDVEGNPTALAADEPLSVASDNPSVADVADNGDGTVTVTLASPPALGAAVITASATNEEGQALSVSGTVTVIASDAVSGSIDFNAGQ